ncbi:hypothetical protein BH772_gp031 [Gordonia phage Bachita]|uniref:Uncharacterized protein n=1 Tax=Gordonia phage Bachita TaxID=1838061 RepID=A0A160DIB6_9CAUD|nr:hypothetical protein BH772_gp031 [Gordonia phage Bachita]ANA86854.1 hypothetical protein PBI_BACHITA_180 [Gordonia phage Bachita]
MNPRKRTKFQICSVHEVWHSPMTRRRIAECFCEGGPGVIDRTRSWEQPCNPDQPCRIWPGTDFYVADVCHSEADWPKEWRVNTP